jgi:hypothetical protein
MRDAQHITVKPLPGIPPDESRNARARAWAFIFRCWQEKQEAVGPTPEPDGRDGSTKLRTQSKEATMT